MKNKHSLLKPNKATTFFVIVNSLFMIIAAAVMLIPILKVLSDSFDGMTNYGLNFIPQKFTVIGYKTIVSNSALYRPFFISVVTALVGTGLALFLTVTGAYVITQKDMPGRKIFVYVLLFTMIFHGGLIPSYLVMLDLHLIDTLWAIILPLSVNAYYLILMRNFFNEIPQSTVESAEIDGCAPMSVLMRIILPMSRPAIAAIGLFYAVIYWNDFFNFTIYINNPNLYNFQVKLIEIILDSEIRSTTQFNSITMQNASIIVSIVPIIVIYPFLQKHFAKGLNLGAVKG